MIPSALLTLCFFAPRLSLAAIYAAPPTVGAPYHVASAYPAYFLDLSFASVDPELYTDPAYTSLSDTHDIVAFKLDFTAESVDIAYVAAKVGDNATSPSFVAVGLNQPTDYGLTNAFRALWGIGMPVEREVDGSYSTPTLLLLYPLGTFSQDPIDTLLTVDGAAVPYPYTQLGFGFTIPPAHPIPPPVPEPPASPWTVAAIAGITVIRACRGSKKLA